MVCIRTEYGVILSISLYSVLMRENTDQKNSEYGHFLRSEKSPKANLPPTDSSQGNIDSA